MKIEIKCYRVIQKNEGNLHLGIYDREANQDYLVKYLDDLGESRLFFNEKRCEKIYGKYNNKFPVSTTYMDDIPLVITEPGIPEIRTCMLNEVQEINTTDDINVNDYIFTIEKI